MYNFRLLFLLNTTVNPKSATVIGHVGNIHGASSKLRRENASKVESPTQLPLSKKGAK